MVDVTVEPATRADLEDLVDAWIALARGQRNHGSHLRAEDNRDAVREQLAHHLVGQRVYVARRGDAVVGFVQFSTEEGTYETDVTRGRIENLYVDPDHRQEGVGSRLLDRAESVLADRGVAVLTLDVMDENAAARRFYAKHGYDDHRVTLEKSLETDRD